MMIKIYSLVIVLSTVVLYFNTLKNDYALDDALVLNENQFVKQGVKGLKNIFKYDSFRGFFGTEKKLVQGGRYRPLSLATFAVEYDLFGLKPRVHHAVNIILYGILGIGIFYFLRNILQLFAVAHSIEIAFFTTLIFMVHPVHTEVVANIKGRDEILAMLFGILYLQVIADGIKRSFNVGHIFGAVFLL